MSQAAWSVLSTHLGSGNQAKPSEGFRPSREGLACCAKVQKLEDEIVNNSFSGQKIPHSALKICSFYTETTDFVTIT